MKQNIPWPAKVAVKLLLGFIRVDYRLLKRIRLVEHGRMEDLDFARSVFRRHVLLPLETRARACQGALLEIGPGDSVATGFLGLEAGFSTVFLVDAGPYADLRPYILDRLSQSLRGRPLSDGPSDAASKAETLRAIGISYLTNGLTSMRGMPVATLQHSFSNSVLQHVKRADVMMIIRRLAALHAPGSYTSHLIKFTDHFSGGFLNRRIPDWIMESALVAHANLYTNRVELIEMAMMFDEAGFELVSANIDCVPEDDDSHLIFDTLSDLKCGVAGRTAIRAILVFRRTLQP